MLFAASGGYDSVALAPLYEGPPQRYDFGAGLVFVDRCGAAAFSGGALPVVPCRCCFMFYLLFSGCLRFVFYVRQCPGNTEESNRM